MKKIDINKIVRFMPFSVILLLLCITLGFAAFTSTSKIIASAKYDPYIGIQILNFTEYSSTNGGASNYETDNIDEVTSGAYLPNNNSEITYKVEIINLGTYENGIFNVTGLPSNLEYSFSGYNEQDKICDDNTPSNCSKLAKTTFYMTIKYKENGYNAGQTTYPLDLNFDFRTIHNITYDGFSGTYRDYVIDGGSANITFNQGDIPTGVYVTGATNSYQSPTLSLTNVTSDVGVYKKHTITYVLNGGTQAPNQITSISSAETYTLLEPTKTEENFGGWYDNSELTGSSITTLSNVTSDITLYAKWSTYDYYIDDETFDGTTASVINTNLPLYSTDNVNRNFRIAFRINSYNHDYDNPANINNNTPPTILSSMVETGSPYSGFVFRVVKYNGVSYYSIKVNDSHVTSYLGYFPLRENIDVEIVREDGAMYAKVGSNIYTKLLDYNTSIDTFNIPLTVGGNINSSGNFDRCFDGELSNLTVEFYEGNIVNNVSYTETRTSSSYNLDGTILFTGSNYIDTGLNLFSAANINKDFDISLTVDTIDATSESQATLINAKDETQNNVWPGFAYRLNSSKKFELTSKWPGQKDGKITDPNSTPKTITIKRRNGIIYYSLNGAAEAKLISTPAASLNNPFVPNLTFGASLNSSGSPFRFFKGYVSNISVQLYD